MDFDIYGDLQNLKFLKILTYMDFDVYGDEIFVSEKRKGYYLWKSAEGGRKNPLFWHIRRFSIMLKFLKILTYMDFDIYGDFGVKKYLFWHIWISIYVKIYCTNPYEELPKNKVFLAKKWGALHSLSFR